jgi:hypothetical protein
MQQCPTKYPMVPTIDAVEHGELLREILLDIEHLYSSTE